MSGALPDPFAAFRPLVEGIGGLEQADRVRRGVLLHSTLPRPPVGCTPNQVVHRQGTLRLRYYPPAQPTSAVPVVVVPSMINRSWICDLEPDRSLVGALANAGHPVYMVDWGVPETEDGGLTVADILLDRLHRAIDRACRHAGVPQAFLLGYCQGGTLSAMYTALRPKRVAGLVVFNAPVRFREGGRFASFVDADNFDVDAAIDPERLVPVDVMKVAFKLLDPMGNWQKYLALEAVSTHPSRLARTMARERWLEENVPMPGAFAAEFIRKAYQEDALLDGGWSVRGEAIDLKNIQCPLYVMAAKRDFIAPAPAVMPLADATSSDDVTAEVLDTGHIGVVVGSYGPREFYPRLDRWFRAHNPQTRP